LFDQIINDDLVDIIVHGTKFQKYELEEIKRCNKGLIICPRSNAYFGVGVPPIRDIMNLKIPIAIGTDNIMANSPNLFEELRFIYYLLKIFNKKQKLMSISSKDLLKMVTINAAHIFNMESDIGSISIGKNANFFKVSLKDPNFFVYKLNKDLFHAFIIQRTNQNNINKVFIKGKKIYEH
jgi:cytosine/adenosine deaminase-related metal-dependent hydrolase